MNTQVPPAIAKIAPDGHLTPRQKRRFLIDMALRRIKPGAGSSHEFMKRRTAMKEWPDLRPILRNIDWAIIGGVATRAYMPERETKDPDILVRREDSEEALQQLREAGFKIVTELAVPGYLLISPEGAELDVPFGDYEWLDQALQDLEQDAAGYPVVKLPYLILLKMKASRPQDIADMARMLGWAEDEQLNAVRKVIEKYASEDAADLESLIFLGRMERGAE